MVHSAMAASLWSMENQDNVAMFTQRNNSAANLAKSHPRNNKTKISLSRKQTPSASSMII